MTEDEIYADIDQSIKASAAEIRDKANKGLLPEEVASVAEYMADPSKPLPVRDISQFYESMRLDFLKVTAKKLG